MRSLVSLLSLLIAAVVSVQSFSSSFENTAVVRTVELGGSTTHVTTTYQVRALENDIQQYVFVLSADDAARTSWLEAKVKGSSSTLKLEATGAECVDHITAHLHCILLTPHGYLVRASANESHCTARPCPKSSPRMIRSPSS